MSVPSFPARPTVYRGIQMRSRLEAKFAGFLDTHPMFGAPIWTWEYEPCAFADGDVQYLPDFRLTYTATGLHVYIEIKGVLADLETLQRRMEVIRASDPGCDLWILLADGNAWIGNTKFGWSHAAPPSLFSRWTEV